MRLIMRHAYAVCVHEMSATGNFEEFTARGAVRRRSVHPHDTEKYLTVKITGNGFLSARSVRTGPSRK